MTPTHRNDKGPNEGQRLELARLLARLEPEISRVEGEQRARGVAPGAAAVLVIDTESPLIAATLAWPGAPSPSLVPAAVGPDLPALPSRMLEGRYFVADASADDAASLARALAADEGGDVESAVRALAGKGRTVVFAVAGPLYAAHAFARRQAPRSRGGSA